MRLSLLCGVVAAAVVWSGCGGDEFTSSSETSGASGSSQGGSSAGGTSSGGTSSGGESNGGTSSGGTASGGTESGGGGQGGDAAGASGSNSGGSSSGGTQGGAGQGTGGAGQAGSSGSAGSNPGGSSGSGGAGGGCPQQFADCDGDPSNGCEVDLQNDATNCGACNAPCALDKATAACNAGACVVASCDQDYGDCDQDPANGCEVFLGGDTNNCGKCGMVCSAPSGKTPVCTSGSCSSSSCVAPLQDCDQDPQEICEANLSDDAANCGACGKVCSFANASASCASGGCVMGACSAGFEDCHNGASDGCETNLQNDPNNCGTCGKACSLPNAATTCNGGACVFQGCQQGFKDLNNTTSDGCEFQCPVFPTSAEICNGLDDDCDGVIDNGLTLRTFNLDQDNDGYAGPSGAVTACAPPPGYAAQGGDCDDTNAAISPASPELCGDQIDNNCSGVADEASVCCPDKDGDGLLSVSCGGTDCDDTNPAQGAGEICGDSLDNNCNGTADDGCSLGVYVSISNGNDSTGTGTQGNPYKTISKGITIAALAKVPVFVAQGTYDEKFSVVEGVSLFGGYQCSGDPCQWNRDPSLYVSKVVGPDNTIHTVTVPQSVTQATRLDGFWVVGADVENTNIFSNTEVTASAIKLFGTPVLSGNVIVGGAIKASSSSHRSAALWISNNTSTSSPLSQSSLIVGNVIVGGTVTNSNNNPPPAMAIGILVNPASGQAPPWTEVRNNTIVGGSGQRGLGMLVWGSNGKSLLSGNKLFAGSSNSGDGWALDLQGAMLIDRNQFNVGSPTLPVGLAAPAMNCSNSPSQEDFFCGGLKTNSATATVTNNVFFGLTAAPRSAAVKLTEVEQAIGSIVLNGNYLHGQGAASGGAVCAALAMNHVNCGPCGINAVFGSIRNNILDGGSCANNFGVYEAKTNNFTNKTAHPKAFSHNDIFFSKGSGTAYRLWSGSSAVTTADPLQISAIPFPQGVTIGPVLAANPMQDASFHLLSGSPCINAGTATEAPALDFDSEARPKGATTDIGPDEAN